MIRWVPTVPTIDGCARRGEFVVVFTRQELVHLRNVPLGFSGAVIEARKISLNASKVMIKVYFWGLNHVEERIARGENLRESMVASCYPQISAVTAEISLQPCPNAKPVGVGVVISIHALKGFIRFNAQKFHEKKSCV